MRMKLLRVMRQARKATGGGGIVASERKEYRAATDRIDDRERALMMRRILFATSSKGFSGQKSIAERTPLPLFCVSAESKGLKVACFDTLV